MYTVFNLLRGLNIPPITTPIPNATDDDPVEHVSVDENRELTERGGTNFS